jgi:hypothetical protein
MDEKINEGLNNLWQEMKESANTESMRRSQAIITFCFEADLLTADEHDLWMRNIRVCPGHECCRVWCAYCGEIELEDAI